jgi:hypothetical protein
MRGISRFLAARYANEWWVTRQGSGDPTSIHLDAGSAWADARRRARGVGGEAQLNDEHGRLRVRNSYKGERNLPAK